MTRMRTLAGPGLGYPTGTEFNATKSRANEAVAPVVNLLSVARSGDSAARKVTARDSLLEGTPS